MNIYILTLLVLLFASCNPGHYKRVRVDSGFKYGEAPAGLLFPRSSIGLRGGITVKDSIPWGAGSGYGLFNAMCWRTIDGGRNWQLQKITDGSFNELTIKDDIVYAIISTGGGPNEVTQDKIYESRDLGKTWNLKCAVDAGIVRVHVMDSSWIIGDIGGKLGETRDGGKSWRTLQTQNPIGRSFYHDKYVYYFSHSERNTIFDIFVRRDLYTGEEKKMMLPDGVLGQNGKEKLVFCSKNNELRTYLINDDFTLTYLSSIKQEKLVNVDYVGIYKEHIFIFVQFVSPCFLWNEDSFYYSSNGGRSWKHLGNRGITTGVQGRITDYMDSTGFKVIFYRDIYSLGTFSVPAGK